MLIADSAFEIYVNYNIQFIHLLKPDVLTFSFDKAMNKMAKDMVYRLFNGLYEKSLVFEKDNMTHKLNKDILIECILNGYSDKKISAIIKRKPGGGQLTSNYTTGELIENPSIRQGEFIYFKQPELPTEKKMKYIYRYKFQFEDLDKYEFKQGINEFTNELKDFKFEDSYKKLLDKKVEITNQFVDSLYSKEGKLSKQILTHAEQAASNDGQLLYAVAKILKKVEKNEEDLAKVLNASKND